MSQESTVDGAPAVRVDRALLESWPGRFRFPDVLVRLVAAETDGGDDGAELARAVLSRAGGRPPRAVCEELVERGEFAAAAYVQTDCRDLAAHEKESLRRKLESAQAAAGESVRQRVRELERRAAAAGVAFGALDVDALVARAQSRRATADGDLDAAAAALARQVEPVAVELRSWLGRQAADTSLPPPGTRRGGSRH
ncbi:hypothetical protein DN402_08570 [Streptomyces sp. SW4]|nr:hypothetical protein DN402_08570 [Streptomyces sp. SW4]